jgi:hypothetical protein
MTKNRKKKLRKITVDGDVFKWAVTDFNHDGDGGSKFRIWKDGHLIHNEVIQTGESINIFNDAFSSVKVITPKDVAAKIKTLKGLGASVRTKEGKIKI